MPAPTDKEMAHAASSAWIRTYFPVAPCAFDAGDIARHPFRIILPVERSSWQSPLEPLINLSPGKALLTIGAMGKAGANSFADREPVSQEPTPRSATPSKPTTPADRPRSSGAGYRSMVRVSEFTPTPVLRRRTWPRPGDPTYFLPHEVVGWAFL